MSNELKPCPFCGGEAEWKSLSFDKQGRCFVTVSGKHRPAYRRYWLTCGKCGIPSTSHYRDSKARPAKQWNNRVEDKSK